MKSRVAAKPDRGHDRILGRIRELVDVALLEGRSGRQQADGLLVDVLPAARGHGGRLVVEARSYASASPSTCPWSPPDTSSRTGRSWRRRS